MTRRTRKWLLRFALAAVVLAAIPPTALGVNLWRQQRHMDRVISEAREQGYPVSLAEFAARRPMPPEAYNAAPVYREAVAMSDEIWRQNSDFIEKTNEWFEYMLERRYQTPGISWSDKAIADADRLTALYEPALARVDAAARMPTVRFIANWEDGRNRLDFDHLRLSGLARISAIEAGLRMREGDTHGATSSLVRIARIGWAASRDPFFHGEVADLSRLRSGMAALEDALAFGLLNDSDLCAIADAYRRDEPAHWGVSYVYDLCHFLDKHPDVVSPPHFPPGASRGETLKRLVELLRTGNKVYLGAIDETGQYAETAEWFLRFVVAFDTPGPAVLDAVAAEDALQTAKKNEMGPMAAMNTENSALMVRMASAFVSRIAYARVIETACAVERYALANGRFPETLEALVPAYLEAVPPDPFDGLPLRYIPGEAGYIVYSIGRDREDDGGNRHNRDGDIVMEVLR